MVGDELWGNVFPMYQRSSSECLVRINPTTGKVIGWIDLNGLLNQQSDMVRSSPMNYVLNGIAFHAKSNRLYVTGKQWNKLYQIKIVPKPSLGAEHIKCNCGLGYVKRPSSCPSRTRSG